MKSISKYLLFLATAAFMFASCEKDIEREPSPAAGKNVAAFKESVVKVDINPMKAALEYGLEIVRSKTDEELKVGIEVVDGDKDIIEVPATVSFAKKEASATLLLKFPKALLDSTYSVTLRIKEDNQSPYLDGASECAFTVNIATWELSATPCVMHDGLVAPLYGVDPIDWYVEFMEKENADGTRDFRFLNPYKNFKDGAEPDQFGVFSVFAYNEEENIIDPKSDYHWEIHVDKDGNATFPETPLGINYGDGAMNAMLLATFYALKNGTDPDYATYGCGIYDHASRTITIPEGVMLNYIDGLGGYMIGEQVIHLNSKAYQDDHLSIADYNDPTIEWEEVKSEVNLFESSIFEFSNEEQKLYKAKDQFAGNPKSPFINLYCLKDAYAEGENLAFYWDGKDGYISIPGGQNTKLTFMDKELFLEEGIGLVSTEKIKGVDVRVFQFDLIVVDRDGNSGGEFLETFYMAEKPIVYEKADFLGNFDMIAYDAQDDTGYQFPIEIKEEDGFMAVLGLDQDTIWGIFDAKEGTLSLVPQSLPDSFEYSGKKYARAFVPFDAKAKPDFKGALTFKMNLKGTAVIDPACGNVGFYIWLPAFEDWLSGLYDLSFAPAVKQAGAPLRQTPKMGHKNTTLIRHNVPTTDHLTFKGKYDPRKLRQDRAL